MQKFVNGLAAFGLIVAVSVTPARAACWSSADIAAAKVRDMETMLMVSALRCRSVDPQLLGEYNEFVRESRGALTSVNDTLRKHFADAGGLNAYDRFVTAIANRYGAGVAGLSCGDMASILSAAKAEGGSLTGLTRLANDAQVIPVISGTVCPSELALAQ